MHSSDVQVPQGVFGAANFESRWHLAARRIDAFDVRWEDTCRTTCVSFLIRSSFDFLTKLLFSVAPGVGQLEAGHPE